MFNNIIMALNNLTFNVDLVKQQKKIMSHKIVLRFFKPRKKNVAIKVLINVIKKVFRAIDNRRSQKKEICQNKNIIQMYPVKFSNMNVIYGK